MEMNFLFYLIQRVRKLLSGMKMEISGDLLHTRVQPVISLTILI